MIVAERLVEILEEENIEHIFGIPGDQILPMYKYLQKSSIKHILTRHEQAACHAADGYYRSSGKIGVCISTASPGALNFTMALATAFKDNVPILVITGDNDLDKRDGDYFQSLPQVDIFKNIVRESYSPLNGTEAVFCMKAALYALKNNPTGPVHINLSRDVLLSDEFKDYDLCYLCEKDLSDIEKAQDLISSSKKPVFVLGSGAITESERIKRIVNKYKIPVTTTFPAKGIVSENEDINLGLCGVRGNPQSDYAIKNSDCIIALGIKASERTLPQIPENLIHVNINRDVLTGECRIHGKVSDFLDNVTFIKTDWLSEILKSDGDDIIYGVEDDYKPQAFINLILKRFPDNIIVSDAGSHTTWTTLLKKSDKPRKLLFSGGLAPMGYGLPAAIGASIATSQKIILINGDGDFQMNLQELATISENNLDILIFIIDNSELGIIRQWQETFYEMDPYAVKLSNPCFTKLADSYGISGVEINCLKDMESLLKKDIQGPMLIDVKVLSENIPLP